MMEFSYIYFVLPPALLPSLVPSALPSLVHFISYVSPYPLSLFPALLSSLPPCMLALPMTCTHIFQNIFINNYIAVV